MKKIIILFVLSCLTLYSQDVEPNQLMFRLGSINATFLSADSAYFKQDSFLLGWAWGFDGKMSAALLDNQAHVPSNLSKDQIKNNVNLIINTDSIWDPGSGTAAMNSQSIIYSPVLHITNPETQTNIRSRDPKHSIFGFRIIRGESIGDSDVSLKLRTSGAYVSGTVPVLDSAWMNNALYYYLPNNPPVNFGSINTDTMYFVINLRRANLDDTIRDNWPVLKIRLPYKFTGAIDSIQFSKLPDTTIYPFEIIRSSFNDSIRGIARPMMTADPNTREIVITRRMLPIYSDFRQDITISAEFICAGDPFANNPKLNSYDTAYSLGIKIFYLGNSDVNINNIYLATPWARDLYCGKKDYTIQSHIQTDLNHYTDTSFSNYGCKPFRFFTRDEINASYFGAIRYFNKFVGNISTTQSGIIYPKLYYYYTNSPDDWVEDYSLNPDFAVPYFKNSFMNVPIYLTLGIYWGYKFMYGDSIYNYHDTLNSGYETHLRDEISLSHMRDYNYNDYKDKLYYSSCFQAKHEYNIINNFKDETMVPLYSNKFWWADLFVGSNFKIDSSKVRTGRVWIDYNRVKTGEEMRLEAWFNLILGAKGLLYDKETNTKSDYNYLFGLGNGENYYVPPLDTMNFKDFIRSDVINKDFLDTLRDWNHFLDYIPYDSVATTMGVARDRIYMGRKSPRVELWKIHNWIRTVDDTLMKLHLSAWYDKGFKVWQNQDTAKYGSQIILSKYILLDTTKLKTRKIFDPRYNTFNNPKEIWDSTFFDLTLLRSSYDTNMKNLFFVAAQNRRTDPLLYYTNPADTNTKYMRFLSTAEFEDSCKTHQYSTDTLLYQSYWWKRLGCRELTIPFNYNGTPNQFDGYILHVSELGVGSHSLDSILYPWREAKYYHKIDTTITEDGSVIIRMLPGEGKILKVRVVQLINGGKDSSNGKHCTGCEVINDTSQFKIEVEKNRSDTVCCWDLKLINNSSCTFTNLPIDIDLPPENFSSSTFTSTNWASNTFSNQAYSFYYTQGIMQPHDTSTIGTICIPEGNNFTITITIGKLYGDTIYHCDRTWNFAFNCPCSDSSCCNKITVNDTSIVNDVCYQTIQQCCHPISINVTEKYKQCCNNVFVIKAALKDSSPPSPGIIPPNPINFNNGPYVMNLCFNVNTNPCGIYCKVFRIYFYNSEGTIICVKEDSVCCDFNPPRGAPKGFKKSSHDDGNNKKIEPNDGELIIESFYCVPNPVNDEATIYYQQNKEEFTKTDLFNNLGELIKSIYSGYVNEGLQSYRFNTSNLSPGIYYVRLRAGKIIKMLTLIVIR